MAIVEKKYCVIYSDDKSIKYILFGANQSINTPHNSFGTDNYQELVDYIYTISLFEDDSSNIDYDELKKVEEDVEETLFKFDD